MGGDPGQGQLTEKEQLATFVVVVAEFMERQAPIPAELSMAEHMRQLDPCKTPLAGWRDASRDMVEWAVDLTPAEVFEVDALLSARNVPTLTAMRNRRYRSLLKVLARGVKSAGDYRLLEAFLADTADTILSVKERTLAGRRVEEYDAKNT